MINFACQEASLSHRKHFNKLRHTSNQSSLILYHAVLTFTKAESQIVNPKTLAFWPMQGIHGLFVPLEKGKGALNQSDNEAT